jgi:hypothetical protein
VPLSRRAARALVLLSLPVLVVAYLAVRTSVEQRAIAAQSPAVADDTSAARRVDRTALLHDLRALADPALEGRRTGTDGSRRARAYIAGALQTAGVEPLDGHFEHSFSFVHRSVKAIVTPGQTYETAYPRAANIAGIVGRDGARPRWIVVSAHYDHLGKVGSTVYPGADDNASGVAVLLAAARIVAKEVTRHVFVFVAFDAEELGLEGAKHFVAAEHLTRDRVAIDVNLDMVSRNDRREIFAAGTSTQPWLRPLLDRVQRRSTVRILFGHDRPAYQAGRVEDWTHASDHGAFVDAGIPFLYFGVEDHADYHKPTDTADRVDPEFFGDVADMVIETLLTLDGALN